LEQNVFWFEIAMDEVFLVELAESLTNISGNATGHFLIHDQRLPTSILLKSDGLTGIVVSGRVEVLWRGGVMG
jgi:hypothetical protein